MNLKLLLEPHVLAVIVSLLVVWGATEYIKRLVRRTTSKRDDWMPRGLGLVLGLGIGSLIWPNDTDVEPWIFGLMIGLIAPTAYWAMIAVIRWKWPDLAKLLTGRGAE